jgi:SAM-dependent methyltransferase
MSCTVEDVRRAELEAVREWFPPGTRVLDLGAGSGFQASVLASWGCDVEAVDVDVRDATYFPVRSYDGLRLPHDDDSFDRVFSSNVLEHVASLSEILTESARVLRSGGKGVHLMPSATWRFWSAIAHYAFIGKYGAARALGRNAPRTSFPPPQVADVTSRRGWRHLIKRALVPGPHGEFSSAWIELRAYARPSWRRRFRSNGFMVERDFTAGVFYAGYGVIARLTLRQRRRLARYIGSGCNAFVVRPTADGAR